jgi:nitrogen fixation protein NifU and related proteins
MHDRLKETADEVQAAILKEAETTYSPGVIERWQNPRNWGQMENPDGLSKISGPCGETMQIALKVVGDRIAEVRFMTDGCATSIASGSMATELAQGRAIGEAQDITPEMIFDGSEDCRKRVNIALFSHRACFVRR